MRSEKVSKLWLGVTWNFQEMILKPYSNTYAMLMLLEHLRDVEFVDIRYSLTAKTFQLISYYELSGYEVVFYDACSSFAKYCRRNTVIGKQSKELNLNFVHFIKRLYQAKHRQTETKKDLLKKLANTSLPFSDWFKEKVEQDIK